MKANFDTLDNEQLLTLLDQTRTDLNVTKLRYLDLVREISARGVPNTTVARRLKVSETAIRNYKKRKGITRQGS